MFLDCAPSGAKAASQRVELASVRRARGRRNDDAYPPTDQHGSAQTPVTSDFPLGNRLCALPCSFVGGCMPSSLSMKSRSQVKIANQSTNGSASENGGHHVCCCERETSQPTKGATNFETNPKTDQAQRQTVCLVFL